MTVFATNLWYFFQGKTGWSQSKAITQLLHHTILPEQFTTKASTGTLLWGKGREPVTFRSGLRK